MDAVRLIGVGRRALAASSGAPEIMIEAWQAQSLAQAVGSRLAVAGPPELRGEALGLSEIGGRGCGALTSPLFGVDRIRAAQLSGIGDAHQTLTELGRLLTDVGIALVQVASAADEDRTYWQCMEAIDAADECRDRVLEMLRRLAVREESEAHSRARGPQEPGSGHEAPRARPPADCATSVPAQPVSPQVADGGSAQVGPAAAAPSRESGRPDRRTGAAGARVPGDRCREHDSAGPVRPARPGRSAPSPETGLRDGQPPDGRKPVQQAL